MTFAEAQDESVELETQATQVAAEQSAAPAPDWSRFFARAQGNVGRSAPLEVRGTLTRLAGLVLEPTGTNPCWPRWWASPMTVLF